MERQACDRIQRALGTDARRSDSVEPPSLAAVADYLHVCGSALVLDLTSQDDRLRREAFLTKMLRQYQLSCWSVRPRRPKEKMIGGRCFPLRPRSPLFQKSDSGWGVVEKQGSSGDRDVWVAENPNRRFGRQRRCAHVEIQVEQRAGMPKHRRIGVHPEQRLAMPAQSIENELWLAPGVLHPRIAAGKFRDVVAQTEAFAIGDQPLCGLAISGMATPKADHGERPERVADS
jgi:hypothetical protein